MMFKGTYGASLCNNPNPNPDKITNQQKTQKYSNNIS